ncbi:calcium/sodium antiporter [Aureibacter tunicatorum]|uniref:Cation:H+ antiporter n=1 Tax=Aureibacter tunicatorum TaxID=866807 RepID=A0AAE3XLW2_9BACT|nr:calcium/sodium antiporter [Aureibacter tunicatorum]MDR6238865.1 cation:H+ antiporter [Aureibacter tunicatorum]BDD05208.1 K+-dependent Na+/Ca+ exchanger [Aureibacter tunicatorum]
MVSILLVLVGFACLIFGANWLVDGASALAKKFNVPDLAIGLTVVAFGTSAPELVVNTFAAYQSHSDIVLGNVIGSNNFNLFIILGLSALIYPIKVQSSTAWKEIPISLTVTIIVIFLLNDFFFVLPSRLSRADGVALLVSFFIFLYYVFKQMKNNTMQETEVPSMSMLKIAGLILLGLSGLVAGGQLVVVNSVYIAESFGVSEKIIGLTIVAAGTSLPELMTSIVASLKKNSDIAIGNVIGSNIFNLLLILSLSGIIHPISFNPKFNLDLYILLGGTMLLLIFMLTGQRKKLDRWEGALLMILYLGYMIYLIVEEL